MKAAIRSSVATPVATPIDESPAPSLTPATVTGTVAGTAADGPAEVAATTVAGSPVEVGAAIPSTAIPSTGSASEGGGLPKGVDLLDRLEKICVDQGLGGLAGRLGIMSAFLATDLARFEREFATLPRRPQLVGRSASHLLDLGGKRLRPLCLSLASRIGTGFDQKVLDLAVAIELVHSATLLHDDVVDAGDTRRGGPTSRAIYGNAASIFAGDWLLIEALRRVRRTGFSDLLDSLFDIVEEMIFAESLQLENRGRLSMDRSIYFQVVEGKTASVFRWAMTAGGRAGGLERAEYEALAAYGQHLGITFQAVDDLLDLTGDSTQTGKSLFTDLREGKMTLPLILAIERSPEVRDLVEQVITLPAESVLPDALARAVVEHLRRTRAVEDCLAIARDHSRRAIEHLEAVPSGQARRALATVAEAIVDRDV